MIKKPKFKDCFTVEILDSGHVFLLREEGHRVLSGKAYKKIAPWLDGNHSLVDLADRLKGELSLPMIQLALNRLEAQGAITEANGVPSEQTAFLYAMGANAGSALSQLEQTAVSVSALGEADATPLIDALAAEGLQVVEGEGDLNIVVVEDYLERELEKINKKALKSGTPWLPIKLTGSKSWIGPIFQPEKTACWACMAQRLRANRQVESFVLRHQRRQGPIKTSVSALPSTLKTAAFLATTELVKFIVQGKNDRLENKLLMFDHTTMQFETHTVVQRPQCAACGQSELHGKPTPIELDPDVMTDRNDLRLLSAEKVLAQLEHHISEVTGVVTGLRDMTSDSEDELYVYAAGHYFPLVVDSVFWLKQNIKSHSGGKGTTRLQAKVSAIGEAIERYSCIHWGHEETVNGRYQDLQPLAIHPNAIMNFSQQQYAGRHDWNKTQTGRTYQVVPNPFDESQEVAWRQAYSLSEQRFKYLYAPQCYYGHPQERYFYNLIDSNGVAAGSSVEEALIQAFLELVERDSVGLWWYNRVRRPAVDLNSFNVPYLSMLQQRYHDLKRDVWVLDITSDLGIPAFAAISRWQDAPTDDIIYGFAAHLNPQTALMQAITEMNQTLPAVRFNADGKGGYRWPPGEALEWWKHATVANQPYLLPDASVPQKTARDYQNLAVPNLKSNVMRCVDIINQAGMEMLALDMSQKDIGLNVVRVVVPGLRHFWRRLGPGRLYDLPVQLGWLETPTAEEDMNPYSIFF